MDPEDDLIDRLQSLGAKLDERREQATAGGGASQDRRVRSRKPLAWAAVLLAVAALAGALAVWSGQDHDETIRTAVTTTTTTEVELDPAEVQAVADELRARADQAVADCAAADATTTTAVDPPPDPTEFQAVGIGPGCLKGWVRTEGTSGDELVPVYPAPDSAEVIGYWLVDVGWVTIDDAKDPAFDPALLRAAAEQVAADEPEAGD